MSLQSAQAEIGKSLVKLAEVSLHHPPPPEDAAAMAGADDADGAARELARFRSEHASLYERLPQEDDSEQIQRTESTFDAWIREGRLIPARQLALAWHRTRQALDQARARGELFGLRVRNRWWYPAVFEGLTSADVAQGSREMTGGDPVSMFIFWQRPHGALGGRTAGEAVREAQLGRVCELARALAEESGWREVDDSAA